MNLIFIFLKRSSVSLWIFLVQTGTVTQENSKKLWTRLKINFEKAEDWSIKHIPRRYRKKILEGDLKQYESYRMSERFVGQLSEITETVNGSNNQGSSQ